MLFIIQVALRKLLLRLIFATEISIFTTTALYGKVTISSSFCFRLLNTISMIAGKKDFQNLPIETFKSKILKSILLLDGLRHGLLPSIQGMGRREPGSFIILMWNLIYSWQGAAYPQTVWSSMKSQPKIIWQQPLHSTFFRVLECCSACVVWCSIFFIVNTCKYHWNN